MRPDVARDRAFWIARRQPFMRQFLHRLAFIDETSLKTNMIKTTGWAPRGERLQVAEELVADVVQQPAAKKRWRYNPYHA